MIIHFFVCSERTSYCGSLQQPNLRPPWNVSEHSLKSKHLTQALRDFTQWLIHFLPSFHPIASPILSFPFLPLTLSHLLKRDEFEGREGEGDHFTPILIGRLPVRPFISWLPDPGSLGIAPLMLDYSGLILTHILASALAIVHQSLSSHLNLL